MYPVSGMDKTQHTYTHALNTPTHTHHSPLKHSLVIMRAAGMHVPSSDDMHVSSSSDDMHVLRRECPEGGGGGDKYYWGGGGGAVGNN